jgi:DNA-binding IclR family transcriptional regulator
MNAAFAVAAVGLASEVQQAPLEHLARLVLEAAQAISRALGAPSYPQTPVAGALSGVG